MAEDSTGHVWIAMADTALIIELNDDEVVRTIGAAEGLPEPMQLLIAGTGDTLWLAGATTRRLFRFSNNVVRAFTLPVFAKVMTGANAVLVPSRNELWFASSVGIGRH